jgi:Mitochondrial carrier protein.
MTTTNAPTTAKQILQQSAQKAISGGKAGATASVVQVLSLMWLRTSMNYQYRYGGTLGSSLKNLYDEGGVGRLYQGLPFALIQGPLTRFGDTAANVGILALLNSIPEIESLPLPLKTACGSICAGLWRIVLMPVDTSKTVMQVEGKSGLEELFRNVGESGVGPLYRGALASAAATAVGHFPWFLTYNFLNDVLPPPSALLPIDNHGVMMMENIVLAKLVRSALLGFSASCVSDVCSNSLRVIKTTKQTAGLNDSGQEISYKDALDMILEKDGWTGLFGRGLSTRLLMNAIQGAVFSVLWRYFQELSSVA